MRNETLVRVFTRAARSVAKKREYACYAIAETCGYLAINYDECPAVTVFSEYFTPSEEQIQKYRIHEPKWFGDRRSELGQNERVLALLLAAEIHK